MKHLAIFALILPVLTALSFAGPVAIYDYRGSSTSIGGTQSLTATGAGALVIDLETYAATYIGLINFGTRRAPILYFQEIPLQNYVITQIAGPRGATYTVLAKAEAPGTQYAGVVLQQDRAMGVNSLVTIKTLPSTLTWILPRKLSSSGFVLTADQSNDYMANATGTYTLNTIVTTAYNNAALSAADFVQFVRNYYQQQGTPELILPPAN
jgi:hypothetical protein